MDSSLWTACASGDIKQARLFFDQGSSVDLEAEDAAGLTLLIHAIKSNSVELVQDLLYRGANPSHASSQGPLESFTTNEKILLELESARSHVLAGQQAIHHHQQQPMLDSPDATQTDTNSFIPHGARQGLSPEQQQHIHFQNQPFFYPAIDAQGMHYPGGMHMPQSSFYQPFAAPEQMIEAAKEAQGQLPPTEVARQIPCRFFPDCRYGNECAFLHPSGNAPIAAGIQQFPYPMQSPHLGSPTAMPYFDPAAMPAYGYPSPYFAGMSPSLRAAQFGGPASPIFVPSGQNPMSPNMAHGVLIPGEHHESSGMTDHISNTNALDLDMREGEAIEGNDGANTKKVQFELSNRSQTSKEMGMKKNKKSSSFINKPVFPDNHPRDGTLPPCAFFSSGAGKCRNGDACKFPHLLPDGTDCRDPVIAGTAPLSVLPHANKPVAKAHKQFNSNNNAASGTHQNSRHGSHKSEKKSSTNNKSSENATNSKPSRASRQKVPTSDDFPSLSTNKTATTSSIKLPLQSSASKGLTAAQILAQAPVKPAAPADPKFGSEQGSVSDSIDSSIVMVSSVGSLTTSEIDLVHVHPSKSSNNVAAHLLPSHAASFAATVSA